MRCDILNNSDGGGGSGSGVHEDNHAMDVQQENALLNLHTLHTVNMQMIPIHFFHYFSRFLPSKETH